MNNSKLIETYTEHPKAEEVRGERISELAKLLEAIDHIRASEYWKIIQVEFDKRLKNLTNQLKKEKDTVEIFRLQGHVNEAERLNLDKTAEQYRQELQGIRKELNGSSAD